MSEEKNKVPVQKPEPKLPIEKGERSERLNESLLPDFQLTPPPPPPPSKDGDSEE